MNYIIKINYMDGKDVNVALPEEEVKNFLEKLAKSEPYWSPDNETAFWTSNDKIRYANVHKEADPEALEETPEVKEEVPTLPTEDVKEL